MQDKQYSMSNPQDYSKILYQAYDTFMLPLGGKKIPTPYRVNLPFQPDRRKYGKFNPYKLAHDTKQIAQEQSVNLQKFSAEEIRQFMIKNQLGIDCSGFAYQMLNHLLNKLRLGNMKKNGFPKPSSTNVHLLASDKFTIPVKKATDIRTSDLITFNRGAAKLPHVLLILDKTDHEIIYAHSTGATKVNGVQIGKIKITDPQQSLKYQEWDNNLRDGGSLKAYFDETQGDGIKRLKALL